MNIDEKECPYCGEIIKTTAKKCRFCGEWFEENESRPTLQTYRERPEHSLNVPTENDASQSMTAYPPPPPPVAVPTPDIPNVSSPSQPMFNHGTQQNIVVQPQIIVENKQEQNVNVEVHNKQDSSSSGCMWTQLFIVAGVVWGASGSFWFGLATFLILGIAFFIPFLGHALCVILGVVFGIGSGVISKSLGADTWIAWLIGIVVGLGLIFGNLSQREEETE